LNYPFIGINKIDYLIPLTIGRLTALNLLAQMAPKTEKNIIVPRIPYKIKLATEANWGRLCTSTSFLKNAISEMISCSLRGCFEKMGTIVAVGGALSQIESPLDSPSL
jgi:hypothetical protein